MLKVLHTVLSLETGGLENGVVNLINFAPADIQVDVLCLRAGGELIQRISNPNTKIHLSDAIDQNDHSLKSSIQAHFSVFEKQSYDIIHSHGWATMLPGFIGTRLNALKTLRKRALMINGEHGVFYNNNWRQQHVQRFLFNQMDANLAVSAALGRQLENAFRLKTGAFHAILNGVNTSSFSKNDEVRSLIRQKIGVKDDQLVIGSVGRLEPVKNFPLMIQAFSKLKIKHPNQLKLVLCGDGSVRSDLESLAQELNLSDDVIFTGRISNVNEWMQAFDIFTLSSDHEGLPNTLLEAMSLGKASVVTDVGGSREVLNSSCGYLTPAKDLTAYIEALDQLISNPESRLSMGLNASQHIASHLSIEEMARNYYEFYRSLDLRGV